MIKVLLQKLGLTERDFELYNKHFVKRNIPLAKLGCSPQEFSMWKKYGLVEYNIGEKNDSKRVNVKLNLIEALWIKLLMELKKFGIEAVRYKTIHSYLQEDYTELFNQKLKKGINDFIDANQDLKNEFLIELQRELNKKGSRIIDDIVNESIELKTTYFSLLVTCALMKNSNIHLYMYMNDRYELCCFDYMDHFDLEELTQKYEKIKSNSHIYISIQNLILQVIGNEDLEFQLYESNFYSKHLMLIFEMIRKEEVLEISIVKKAGNILEIKITEESQYKNEEVRRIKQAIGFNDCKEINIKTRNNKHLIVRKTKTNTYELVTQ